MKKSYCILMKGANTFSLTITGSYESCTASPWRQVMISHWFRVCREPHTLTQRTSAAVTAVNPAVWKEDVWDRRVFTVFFLLLSVCIYMWKTFSLTPHVCRWESSGCLRRTDVCGANVFRSMRKCSSSIQTHPAISWTRQPVHWAQSSSAIQ